MIIYSGGGVPPDERRNSNGGIVSDSPTETCFVPIEPKIANNFQKLVLYLGLGGVDKDLIRKAADDMHIECEAVREYCGKLNSAAR